MSRAGGTDMECAVSVLGMKKHDVLSKV